MISVIVPAHQEEEQIAETLQSLAQQTNKDIEVIVIANGCTDRTAEKARKFKVNVFETKKRGIGFACNYGANRAKGNILLFLEADTTLPKDMLAEIKNAITGDIVGGTARMEPKEDKLPYKVLCQFFAWGNGADWGPVRICRKDVYDIIGGHRENADFGVDGDFRKKVQAQGQTAYLDVRYQTSMRRFERLGWPEMARQHYHYMKSKLFSRTINGDYPVVR